MALQILFWLPVESLLAASRVSKRWNMLCTDQSLWKSLCTARGWKWKSPNRLNPSWHATGSHLSPVPGYQIDEGVGDDETERTLRDCDSTRSDPSYPPKRLRSRNSSPAFLPSLKLNCTPDYRALFKTRTILRNRLRNGDFRQTTIQAHPRNMLSSDGSDRSSQGHTSTIYALCLSHDPATGESTLFTASRDQTIIQWDMSASPHFRTRAIRTFKNGHLGSVLSVCVVPELGYLISGGSDGRIVVWSISAAVPIKVFEGQDGHSDSVLCVRCTERIIVSCSKDRTIRTYNLSILEPIYILVSHRAAVNSVAISDKYIVSASGDRSLRLWNSETGELLHAFESHHARGCVFSSSSTISGYYSHKLCIQSCIHRLRPPTCRHRIVRQADTPLRSWYSTGLVNRSISAWPTLYSRSPSQ